MSLPHHQSNDTEALPASLNQRVLTAEGAEWGDLKPELRQLCALVDDGQSNLVLYVSSQHRTDHFILAFMDRLDRAGVAYEVRPSTMSEIKALYQLDDSPKGTNDTDTTHRQREMVEIMGRAHERQASDIHLVVGHDITRILFRVHGQLTEFGQIPSANGIELCSALYNSMCDVADEHFQPEISQDARVSRQFVEQLGLFGARVATRPLVDGLLMVLRLLYDDQGKQSPEELGFHDEQIRQLKRLRNLPYGVNLVTGPTGSGKSKSLQITLNLLARETRGTKHILTVEDPPEYPLQANQSPLGAFESWDGAITNSMRLDPDILMYGEVRDLTSAQAAFRGGMTGHQVWSTLHTNNAVAGLQRLIDMGVDPGLVTDPALMTAVINQSLLPVLCPQCKVPAREQVSALPDDLVKRLRDLGLLNSACLVGPGCPHCRQLGIVTRTLVAEVLLPTHRFMQIFRKDGAGAARNYWVQELGGITKTAHTGLKVRRGEIDPRMAETVVGPLDFDLYVLEGGHAG